MIQTKKHIIDELMQIDGVNSAISNDGLSCTIRVTADRSAEEVLKKQFYKIGPNVFATDDYILEMVWQ